MGAGPRTLRHRYHSLSHGHVARVVKTLDWKGTLRNMKALYIANSPLELKRLLKSHVEDAHVGLATCVKDFLVNVIIKRFSMSSTGSTWRAALNKIVTIEICC